MSKPDLDAARQFRIECEARYWIAVAKKIAAANSNRQSFKYYLRSELEAVEKTRGHVQTELRAELNRQLGLN